MPGLLSQIGQTAGRFLLGAAGGQPLQEAIARQQNMAMQQQQMDLQRRNVLSQLAARDFELQQAQQQAAQADELRQQYQQAGQQLYPEVGPPAPAGVAQPILSRLAVQGGDLKTAAALNAPQEVGPLQEIFDPNSPTGTSFVRRSQAIGQPGKPPSGWAIETGPDGRVRVTQGRQAGGMGKKEIETSGAEARRGVGDIAVGERVLRSAQNTPGAFGVRGAVTETVGGLLGQINPALEQFTSAVVSGSTPEKVAEARSELALNVSRSLKQVTGDESGRYTDTERRIAEDTLRTNIGASQKQLIAATSTLLKLEYLSQDRNRMTAGLPPEFDLETKDGTNTFGNSLLQRGYPQETVIDLIESMRDQRQQLKSLGAP